MKIKVFDRCTLTVGDIDFSPLTALGEVEFFDLVPPDELAAAIGDGEIVLVNKAVITAQIMDACPKMRYIGLFATGYNNIDTAAAAQRGITVCNVPGYSTDSVAQLVFALILQFADSTALYDRSVHDGSWIRSHTFSYFPFPITELRGKTLGIFGFGSIGRAVAKIGEAFGMKIIISSRSPKPDCGYPQVSADELFAQSDYLTLHCPLTPQTQGLVNARTLGLMKPTAVLINTSRGGAVVEKDLAAALNNGVIAGAGIDVVSVEPMKADNPLLGAKNCVITPHIAWASKEARVRLIGRVAENITAFISGNPINKVN